MQDVYIPAFRYRRMIRDLVAILRGHRSTIHNPGAGDRLSFFDWVHAALRTGGVPMGDAVLNSAAGRVEPTERLALVTVLMDLPVSPATGDFDASDVRLALGEHGDVWPASIMEDAADGLPDYCREDVMPLLALGEHGNV